MLSLLCQMIKRFVVGSSHLVGFQKPPPPFIEAFQLENLLLNLIAFQLFDLCQKEIKVEQKWGTLLQRAYTISPKKVIKHILSQHSDKSTAMVFICEDGRLSGQVALHLEKENYLNVHALRGGKEGLRP